MKKKVLGLIGLGVTFLVGMVVGYALAEDEYNDIMNNMFEDEEEDEEYFDKEIEQDFDKQEADDRDAASAEEK